MLFRSGIKAEDVIEIPDLTGAVDSRNTVTLLNKTSGKEIKALLNLSGRDCELLLAGGLLAYTKKAARK